MCANREDFESVLKVKINTLLEHIDTAHKEEDELKIQIKTTQEETDQEEAMVSQLHAKLNKLEKTLREKERDNERLREKVHQQQLRADCIDEYKERNEVTEIHENFKSRQLREEYGDLLITNKCLESKAKETVDEITKTEKALRQEEALCESNKQRVTGFEREHADVTKRLENMLRLQEDIRERERLQKEKIRALREKHAGTESRANKLEESVKRMEGELDHMTERLVDMKNEQDHLVCKMNEEKLKIDQSILNSSQNDSIHKAMKIRQHKN
jgi:hypothetical protein